MANLNELSEANFESLVTNSSIPVLVDFYAPWCGPCKMLAPVLEKLAKEFEGRIAFYKTNVDEAQDLAMRYGITGVPTLLLFQDGKQVDSIVGLASPKALQSWLEQKAVSATAH